MPADSSGQTWMSPKEAPSSERQRGAAVATQPACSSARAVPACPVTMPLTWTPRFPSGRPRGEPEPLGELFELFLLRAGAGNRQRPGAHDRGAGPEQAIHAALGEQAADVADREDIPGLALDRGREGDPGLGQGDDRPAGEQLAQALCRHGVGSDCGAGGPERSSRSAAGEEPSRRLVALAEQHDRDAQLRGLPGGPGGNPSGWLLLDLNHVGPEVGEQTADGRVVPLNGGRLVPIAAEGDRHEADAAILAGHPAGDADGQGHAEAGEGAQLTASFGVEIEMGEDDGAHVAGKLPGVRAGTICSRFCGTQERVYRPGTDDAIPLPGSAPS